MIAIVVAGLAAYWTSLSVPFVWDDESAIVTNQTIRSLWPLSGPLSPPPETPVAGRPIANLSLALNYALNGLAPSGFHAWNIGFHIVCGLLLFGVVRRTLMSAPTLRGSPLRTSPEWTALAAALLWMLHPLTSEAVDYTAQRTESLMAGFLLLTLYCAIRGSRSVRRARWDTAACLSCACGMASKESMVVAPLVVLLYDCSFEYDSLKDAVWTRTRLYLGLMLTTLIVVALMWLGPRSTVGFSTGVDSFTYLLNQMRMIAQYLRLSVWPHALVLDYGLPVPLSVRDVAPQMALVIALLAATVIAMMRSPMIGGLAAIVVLTLAPTSSIVPVATEVGAERRMYVPLMALSVLTVIAGRALQHWIVTHWPTASRRVAIAGAAVTLLALLALAARTIARNREFADPVALWRTVVERRPQGRARLGLGLALIAAGQRPEGVTQLQAAAAEYGEARSELGLELYIDGRTDEAIDQLQQFVQARPLHPSRIPARLVLGEALASKGRLDDAVSEFERVLQQAPLNAVARASLADTLFALKRYKEAVTQYQTLAATVTEPALEIKLGTALVAADQGADAIGHFQRALDLDPSSAIAHRRLAEAYWRAGSLADANRHAEEAVRLAPRDADAHNLLGIVLASRGQVSDAVDEFRRAVDLNPADSKARANLQHALTVVPRK